MKQKIIRDSVHGYISIPEPIVDNLIDTEFFQRLKRIEQTSMRPLFPCARHDRFIHSIGVYFLGKKVFESVKNNLENNKERLIELVDPYSRDDVREVFNTSNLKLWGSLEINFCIACLLHDVGHSPMSHTLEDMFKYKIMKDNNRPQFWDELENGMKGCKIPEYAEKTEYFCNSGKSATHEVLSSIIVVKELRDNIKDAIKAINSEYEANYEFIIRCIMGIPYVIRNDTENRYLLELYNTFVSLLHGKDFDVDRLDYLKRDCHAAGLHSSSIDVDRLIKSINLFIDNNHFIIAIDKKALSVVDKYIGAYNDLYLWVYSHHKVVLNTGLICRTFKHIDRDNNKNNYYIQDLFNYDKLVKALLCDDDIWCRIKEKRGSIWEAAELIVRGNSRISLWKSVAEFRDLFINTGAFENKNMAPIIQYINSQIGSLEFEKKFTRFVYKKLDIEYVAENAQAIIFEKTKIKEMSRKKWSIPIIIDNKQRRFCELMDISQTEAKTEDELKTEKMFDSLNEICFYAYIEKSSAINGIKKEDFANFLVAYAKEVQQNGVK